MDNDDNGNKNDDENNGDDAEERNKEKNIANDMRECHIWFKSWILTYPNDTRYTHMCMLKCAI